MNDMTLAARESVPESRYETFSNDALIEKLRFTEFDAPHFSPILRVLGDRLKAHLFGVQYRPAQSTPERTL